RRQFSRYRGGEISHAPRPRSPPVDDGPQGQVLARLTAQSFVTAVRVMVRSTPGLGSSRTATTGRARPGPALPSTAAPVCPRETPQVRKEDMDVDGLVEVGAARGEHDLERLQVLFGLRVAARPGELAGRRIASRRAADGDEWADLGDVIVGPDGGRRMRRGRR